MNTIENKVIAIIGGGPGGLTLARLLQMSGATVKVYERDAHKDARPKGATLDLHDDSGLLAIREAGLLQAFMANYRPDADRLTIMDKHGNIVLEDDVNKESQPARPEIDRGPLQDILLDALLPDTMVWGRQFAALTAQEGSWRIDFKDGSSALADLVVGADGANSKVRPYITPIRPFYSGVTAIEGTVYNSEVAAPNIHRLVNGGKKFAMGDSRSLIVSSKGDGSLAYYAGVNTDEYWWRDSGIDFSDKTQVLAWFNDEFACWDAMWQEIFEQASMPFTPRPQYCMPFDQMWPSLSNLTMLGDAAHLMPPYAGEGVNMAMLDALELSRCLTDNTQATLQSAISSYEANMRTRASDTAAMTMESTAALHSPNAIAFLLNVIGHHD